ncbi:Retrovirus-related Pol polyprotein from transposon TNT 1-94 [Dendrobium catenatum]|uniref:Retrovirus-related Pol polyprotein from transposon TNT 1-94 n=1 Tax=Dendrobium catenatum TaxID=906689 RepID=A0A2I0X929_9ASPA|nr:Retrovirus-related Pol polyprotein from transposon TNT 1-94 [Dendrobium catenatum]
MTSDANQFVVLESRTGGKVTLGDNTTKKVVGAGIIGNSKNLMIENVLLVDGLKHKLLSISQLCDKGFIVQFFANSCITSLSNNTILQGKRINNVYILDLDDSWLWHRRLCHVSMKILRKVTRKDLVRGVPKLKFSKDHLCDACQLGKQVHSTFHHIKDISTSRSLEVLHMDLFGPISTASLGGKVYGFVIVDDYSRFTWTRFLSHKNESFEEFKTFSTWIHKKLGCEILTIHSDHGREFEMSLMGELSHFLGFSIK